LHESVWKRLWRGFGDCTTEKRPNGDWRNYFSRRQVPSFNDRAEICAMQGDHVLRAVSNQANRSATVGWCARAIYVMEVRPSTQEAHGVGIRPDRFVEHGRFGPCGE